ncbi:MAG: tryptophan synthase subunit alpha [Nitriliruptorales bacterium]|nr:tryptophan synthase subunit alpha [Nitriliruptorales bacterium]
MTVETQVAGAERVQQAFTAARDEGRAALVIYLTSGYPDLATSRDCLVAAAESGADVLEVGIPFSDPMMDGPTIQAAVQRSLDLGYRVDDHLASARELAAATDVPAVTMTYVTIADTRGYERFADDLASTGLTGAILPDLPVPEAGPWLEAARARGLATVFLASTVSTDARLADIARASSGFVYATGLLGVTGVKDVAVEQASGLVDRVREHTDLPVAVGIGVKTRQHAATVAGYADGVIVGSAVVSAAGDGDPASAPGRVAELVAELRRGVEQA